jgi:hypothetical protein
MQEKPIRRANGRQAEPERNEGDASRRANTSDKTHRLSLSATTPDLQSAWIHLLSRYHWDLFGSLTFRDATHPESAYKRFRLFLSMLNRKLYGPRWFKQNKGVSYCVAMERQERGVLHFHVLLADPELTHLLKGSWFKLDGRWANELNEMWNQVAGFARIEAIKVHELVQRYVSKYVVKGGEIDLGGPLSSLRLEQAAGQSIATASSTRGPHTGGHSDSVPVLLVDEGLRDHRDTAPVTVASLLPPLQASRASRAGAVAGTQEHSAAVGRVNHSRMCSGL